LFPFACSLFTSNKNAAPPIPSSFVKGVHCGLNGRIIMASELEITAVFLKLSTFILRAATPSKLITTRSGKEQARGRFL
jgi:hypothetical protein